MKKTLRRSLRATLGTTLGLVGFDRAAQAVAPVTSLADPLEAVYSWEDIVFEVPVDKCLTSYHFSYSKEGWHPFVRTLKQYAEDKNTTYETSLLCMYYQRYQPQNAWEVFFEEDEGATGVSDSRMKKIATDSFFPPNPWDHHLIPLRGEGELPASHGVQGYGPVTLEKGRWEFSRLVRVYQSIQEKGYRPSNDSDGEIRGYFLRIGGDYRFFVRAGLHRTAALVAMGYEKLRVKFMPRAPRSIDLADIGHWPLVRSRQIERSVAAHVFRRHFTDNGTRKARNLGLI